jgi:hypothetical protein
VQVDHVPAAGGVVQPVDVLGDQQPDETLRLEVRERVVCPVRLRAVDERPADRAARPVTLAHPCVRHEGAKLHGSCALPCAVLVAVVGNSGARADARARQDREAPMSPDEFTQFVHLS